MPLNDPVLCYEVALFYSQHALLFNIHGERFTDETTADHLTNVALVSQLEARGLFVPCQGGSVAKASRLNTETSALIRPGGHDFSVPCPATPHLRVIPRSTGRIYRKDRACDVPGLVGREEEHRHC